MPGMKSVIIQNLISNHKPRDSSSGVAQWRRNVKTFSAIFLFLHSLLKDRKVAPGTGTLNVSVEICKKTVVSFVTQCKEIVVMF